MPTKKTKADPPRPILQWIAAGVGLSATLAAIGVVIWEAVQPPSPSFLTARIDRVTPTPAGYVADVVVANEGDETAAAVEVEATAGGEVAHATIDYVPGHGEAKAHLPFSSDPRGASVMVKGWAAP